MDPALVPALTLLGALLALDGTALGQFMVSRPLVAGTLAGWILGDPVLGLTVGCLLEIYLLPIFPVGGAQFPEGGPAAVVGVVAAVVVPGPGGLALGTALGLAWSQLGARSIRFVRKINGRLTPDPSEGEVSPPRVVWGHLGALGLDFLRGGTLTLAGLGLAGVFAPLLRGSWGLGMPATLALLTLGASIPAGALLTSLGGWKRRGWVAGAGFLGLLLGGVLL